MSTRRHAQEFFKVFFLKSIFFGKPTDTCFYLKLARSASHLSYAARLRIYVAVLVVPVR